MTLTPEQRLDRLLKRLAEAKAGMQERGTYLRPVSLYSTNVQHVWRKHGWQPPFGEPVPLPDTSPKSNILMAFNARKKQP